jgi:hypothetical protein
MDRIEKPKVFTEFANGGEVNEADSPGLLGPTGREVLSSDGGSPRSEVTGRHDAGSGANETLEGLTSTEEALRRGAEDIPTGGQQQDLEDIPVFDRGDALPKV